MKNLLCATIQAIDAKQSDKLQLYMSMYYQCIKKS